MGLFNIAFLLGWGTGPILGGLVKDSLGTDATFWAMVLMSGAAFAVILLFLPRVPADDSHNRPRAKETPWLKLLGDSTLVALGSFQLIVGLSLGALMSFLPVFMASNLGAGATAIGIVLSTRTLLNGLLVYPYGRLADRSSRVLLVAAGATVTAAGTFVVSWMASFGALLAVLSITGLLESMATPAANAMVVERGRELGMGSVMGIFNMLSGVGVLVGSLAGGLIQDLLGVQNVFRFSAVIILIGVGTFYILMKRAQRHRTIMPSLPDRS